MPKVLISDKMSPKAKEVFEQRGLEVDFKPGMTPDELKAIIGDYDGIAIRSATKLTPELIEAASKLKVVGRAGIGVDNVNLPAASKNGVIVMNTPFGNTVTTAEHTVGLTLAAARHLGEATASTRQGKWEKSRFMGKELYRKNLGIIGTGNIGSLVIERFQGLGMHVVAYDPFISKEKAEDMGVKLVEKLDDFWPMIDFLTVHTPLTPGTKHIVNADAFSKMKDGVVVVNAARGGIFDEDALYDALKSGKVFSAALDVFEDEPAKDNKLFEFDNVIFTPHLGASTKEAQVNVAVQVAEQIADFLLKGTIQNALNIPSVSEKEQAALRPYLNLADKLGTTLGQLTEAGIKKLEISYEGEVAELNLKPITTTILKSVLTPMMESVVNLVNAPVICKERGIEVDETTRAMSENAPSLIRVTITTDKRQRCVTGVLVNGETPRIASMNEVPVEADPVGNLLFIANNDAPGLIGRVGTMLGDAGVNIANFHLGREDVGGRAVAFINIDEEASDELLEQMRAIENVLEVKQIKY